MTYGLRMERAILVSVLHKSVTYLLTYILTQLLTALGVPHAADHVIFMQ